MEQKKMTEEQFWKKYTRCPKCRGYTIQGGRCYGCKYKTPYPKDWEVDLFEPTEECISMMRRMVKECPI